MATSGMACQAAGTHKPARRSALTALRLKLNARPAMATGRVHHSRTSTSAPEELRMTTAAWFAVGGATGGRATDKGTSKVTDATMGRATDMTTSGMARRMVATPRLARISGPAAARSWPTAKRRMESGNNRPCATSISAPARLRTITENSCAAGTEKQPTGWRLRFNRLGRHPACPMVRLTDGVRKEEGSADGL